MRRRRVPPIGTKSEYCDFCGWTYERRELKPQKGGLACPKCYDKPTRVRRTSKDYI